MKLQDEQGNEHDISSGKVVVFCYPKDNTPGCTIEAQEFSSLLTDFEKKDIRVFGISKGDAKSHQKFVTSCDLKVPLLVDEELIYLDTLGVVLDKSMFGKAYKGVERSTFYLEDGKVVKEWRKVNPLGHAKKVLQEL